MNSYDKGDLVRCTGTFTDVDGVATDPATVIFKVKDPSGNITTLTYGVDSEMLRLSAGVYCVDVNIDESGSWVYRFESTGAGQAAGERIFVAKTSHF